jgi:DNA modification methylase
MLYNGDCLEVMPTLETNSVDMVLVDLPFGQTAMAWDIVIDLDKMWVELERICKPNANIVFFCTTKFGYELIKSKEKWFRYDIVWSKPNSKAGFANANRMPMRKHEMVYVFCNPSGTGKTYNPQKTTGHKPYDRGTVNIKGGIYSTFSEYRTIPNNGERYPSSIIEYNLKFKKRLHSTQKPLDLCEWLIKSYSNELDVVLDFTMGSGSTGVACKNTKRNFIGIEMDEEIFNTAKERILLD